MATAVMALTSDAKVLPQVGLDDDERPPTNGQYGQYQTTLRLNSSSSRLAVPSPTLSRRPQIVDVKPEKGDVMDSWKARVPPQPEVCMECAMRDAEMADVDVTSPGIWDRESDVWYEELVRKEREDEKLGRTPSSSGPRAKGLNLTESNLRLWLSMNPKEAHARESNVQAYVKAQSALLEEEHIAHSQAVRESKELTEQMRHTYSSLRRSAYDLSSSFTSEEGVRIRQPSPIRLSFAEGLEPGGSTKKEAVLLENGMIMEKLDLKKEEQARRKRAARSRQRADSRTSTREPLPSAASVRSMSSYTRPTSVATQNRNSQVLPSITSRRSQSSNEATPSMDRGSKSPRFFNFRYWSDAASRSSVALSGSMMDMHIGLEQDQQDIPPLPPLRPTLELSTSTRSTNTNGYNPASPGPTVSLKKIPSRGSTVVSKRKSRFGRLLRLLGGSKADGSEKSTLRDMNGEDQSLPLDPPPPLSLLVDRASFPSLSYSHTRHAQSTLSLSSSSARNPNFSSFTTGSSLLTSPISTKFRDISAGEFGQGQDVPRFNGDFRHIHRMASESDIRHAPSTITVQSRQSRSFPQSAPPRQGNLGTSRPVSTYLDKALPPIPGGQEVPFTVIVPSMVLSSTRLEPFPRYESRTEKGRYGVERDVPRSPSEPRRQSFGGLNSRPAIPKTPESHVDSQLRRYSEFGLSRRSLNRYDDDAMHYYEKPSQILTSKSNNRGNDYRVQTTPSKRRSRFGLSSLFGRKSHGKETSAPEMGILAYSSATSLSQEQTLRSSGHMKHSSACRSTGALVDQDRNFVAYRYPSVNEQFGLPL